MRSSKKARCVNVLAASDEFVPLEPHCRRKEVTTASCPLTSTPPLRYRPLPQIGYQLLPIKYPGTESVQNK